MIVRRLEESDRELMAKWTANDPDHCYYPADWIYQGERKEKMILEDDQGPILGFRISKALRVDIQFNEAEKKRTAQGLMEGFAWLLERAQKAGFSEVIFESKSKPLIRFCKKRFGFVESPTELVRVL